MMNALTGNVASSGGNVAIANCLVFQAALQMTA
jgi:hypothetical protein